VRGARRVLVVGAGSGGQMVARELQLNPNLGARAIGFLDDDPRKRGMRLHSINVLGTTDEVGEILDEFHPDEVIIAIPSAPGVLRGRVVTACRERDVPVRTQPLEHRVAGADANPYLVAAVVLAGMLQGIERKLDPGPPVTGNGYAQRVESTLPTQWPQSIERSARSAFMADALGRGFLDVFVAIKRQECEKFGALVTDRDYDWYLETV
jgi:hypothetical protein